MSAEKIMSETTKMEWVTPEMAAEWLKRNTRNRAINTGFVSFLADEIRSGRWRSTHQGIAFGADGTLFDGQHRLHAIVKSGVSVGMRVTFGLLAEALDAIDTGKARTAAHVLTIADGVKVSQYARAACVSARQIVTGQSMRVAPRVTVHDLRSVLADHLDDFNAAAASIAQVHDKLAQAPLLAALTVMHGIYPKETAGFAAMLKAGGMPKGHPTTSLRDFVGLKYTPHSNTRDALAARTIVAVLTYASGGERYILRDAPAVVAKVARQWQRAKGRSNDGA
jgi:hypothetical protein